ncbi:MAG TPA: hypothetical protein VGT44_23890 [Ktedonobacteraceae bacterium]|nr:hypothetical protein [Ktedonobacteraceae bacterium]
MPTDGIFSTSGASRVALLATSNGPNTTAIVADANGPSSTAIQATSVDPSSTAIQATSGSASSAGAPPTASGACIHAISNDNLPCILAENTNDFNAITAKGLPALDAFDNPPPPSVITIPPGAVPGDGSITVLPPVEGFIAVIQAHASVDLAAGIIATSQNGPGAVVSSAGATGLTAAAGLSPDSHLMGAGHAIVATTNVQNAAGLFASSDSGPGIEASSPDNAAIQATSQSGAGVTATSTSGAGIVVASTSGVGARISSQQATGISVAVGLPVDVGLEQRFLELPGHAIAAVTEASGAFGLLAQSNKGPGARISSQQATGMVVFVGPEQANVESAGHAIAASTNAQNGAGLFVSSANGPGVEASSLNNSAIKAASESSFGIEATSGGATALLARSSKGPGAVVSSDVATAIIASVGFGSSLSSNLSSEEAALESVGHAIAATTNKINAAGLFAKSESGAGVEAVSNTGPGILVASKSNIAVDARSGSGTAVRARCLGGVGLSVEGLLEVSEPAIGAITAHGGETSLQVQNPAATTKSTILLTPLGNPGAFLWINTRAAGSFTIGASQPLPGGLVIQFLIIN